MCGKQKQRKKKKKQQKKKQKKNNKKTKNKKKKNKKKKKREIPEKLHPAYPQAEFSSFACLMWGSNQNQTQR